MTAASRIRMPWSVAFLLLLAISSPAASESDSHPFNSDWRFIRADETNAQNPAFDDGRWTPVTLPHPARIEALVSGRNDPQWQGICWYRKSFDLPEADRGKCIWLRFDGAMNVADVWVNGNVAGHFMGGYLPYIMDISKWALPGHRNVVAVRLDNRDNPITGPKPLTSLDFNLYGGLYRTASLIVKDKLHITDPILADTVAGGGVFVTFPAVSPESAIVRVRVQAQNADSVPRTYTLRTTMTDPSGGIVGTQESAPQTLDPGNAREETLEFTVSKPDLWSPKSPHLYQLRTELRAKGKTLDAQLTRAGIRRIQVDAEGFRINGQKCFLRGVNRHQEYPYIGNALPDAAQYREALKIKEAGFDYVRLSHYPQSPAFLDACDELGLVVMDSIMGWQYFNRDPAFSALKFRECRELIRRDRNHPCVILWEMSLNETSMPKSFVQQANAIAHEEYPGDQCYTCGWLDGYDVILQARQAGGCRLIKDRPCAISEYGDWEYYAQNAGLHQDRWNNLQPAERSSRQLRGDGEIRLLQQALNFQEAHNDDLATPAFADGAWVMFDYNRGYAPDLEASGVMDIFRLPKFSYWFFRTQRDPDELVAGAPLGPVVYIANDWTSHSPQDVRVFSNCEEVALLLNNQLIDRRRPDATRMSSHLRHPPFTFKLERFSPGTLTAVGYIDGRDVARTQVRTPGEPATLALRIDTSKRPFAASGKDSVFCYADLLDAAGTTVPDAEAPVFFGALGQAQLIGSNPILSEAGTATILVESDAAQPRTALYALCIAPTSAGIRILSGALAPDGSKPPAYTVRFTTDGTEPTSASSRYSAPVPPGTSLRAAIFVNDQSVACADTCTKAASTRVKSILAAPLNLKSQISDSKSDSKSQIPN